MATPLLFVIAEQSLSPSHETENVSSWPATGAPSPARVSTVETCTCQLSHALWAGAATILVAARLAVRVTLNATVPPGAPPAEWAATVAVKVTV